MINSINSFFERIDLRWRHWTKNKRNAWLGLLAIISVVILMEILYGNYIRTNFKERAKITKGEILGVEKRLRAKVNSTDLRIGHTYNGRFIIGVTSVTCAESKMIDNISKWRGKSILIAFDTLKPTALESIITAEEYKEYGLKQPDSLKWANSCD